MVKVYDFAQSYRRKEPTLDLMLNVAGLIQPDRVVSDEGLETGIAVNYLGLFALCRELSFTLTAAVPSRIINLAGGPEIFLKKC